MLSGNIYLGMSPRLTTGSSQSNSFGGVSQPVKKMDVLDHWFDAQSEKVLNLERKQSTHFGKRSCSYLSGVLLVPTVSMVPMVPIVAVVSVVPLVPMVPTFSVFFQWFQWFLCFLRFL